MPLILQIESCCSIHIGVTRALRRPNWPLHSSALEHVIADADENSERVLNNRSKPRSFPPHRVGTDMPWEKNFDRGVVLDKAMQAFWSRGYEATSMQDLVDCTGINRGSLYATYGDKRALFLAALRMYDEKMRQKLLAELEAQHAPREAIRHLFLAFLSQTSERAPNRGCFLTNTALELSAHDLEVRRIVANAQAQIEVFFVRMIKQGRDSGAIARDVRVRETARGLLATMIGFVVLTRSRPDHELLETIVSDALRRLD